MLTTDDRAKDREITALSRPDHELVQRSRNGDPEAWSQLIDKYKNLIFSIPIKRGFSREDASDIFQEVCMELLQELEKLRDPQALPKWLITVTSHRCFHHWTLQKRFVNSDSTEPDATRFQIAPDALRIVCEVEKEQQLREALTRLAGRCRRLVKMLFFEEPPRPYKDIADSLGIATGSVGFIRQRCLHRLRRCLGEIDVQTQTSMLTPLERT